MSYTRPVATCTVHPSLTYTAPQKRPRSIQRLAATSRHPLRKDRERHPRRSPRRALLVRGLRQLPRLAVELPSQPGPQHLDVDTSTSLDNTVEVCRLVVQALRRDLIALEIGNEPDLYPTRVRPANYTVVDYVREWNRYADEISRRVLRGNRYGLEEWRFFQGLVYANETLGTFST